MGEMNSETMKEVRPELSADEYHLQLEVDIRGFLQRILLAPYMLYNRNEMGNFDNTKQAVEPFGHL